MINPSKPLYFRHTIPAQYKYGMGPIWSSPKTAWSALIPIPRIEKNIANNSSGKMIEFYILSLFPPERRKIIKRNIEIFPIFKIFKATNGYNKNETKDHLTKSGIKFKWIETKTYGAVAAFLTKVRILQYQIKNNIPYLCFIEDDIALKPTFKKFIMNKLILFEKYPINILRLDLWGEIYVTSLKGSKNILKEIKKQGIIHNIDNQLRIFCGDEIGAICRHTDFRDRLYRRNNRLIESTGGHWAVEIPGGRGAINKTARLEEKF